MAFCNRCGEVIPTGARFCMPCERDLGEQGGTEAAPGSAYEPPPRARRQFHPHQPLGCLIVFALLILVASIFWHGIVARDLGSELGDAKVNLVTNSVRLELPSRGGNGPSGLEFLGAWIAAPQIERALNNWAKEKFDLYAMIIPYTVSIEP